MNTIFGIDFGSAYSRIAYIDEYGKAQVVTNFESERATPSVVYFNDDDSVIVGVEAKNMLKSDPKNVVASIKKHIGDPFFFFERKGIKYTPEKISSFILKKLVIDASVNFGFEIKDVVITCPAYFGFNEREATKKAGEIAGLNVKSIINEPTSAALAYGIEQVQDQTVLVYDLGGDTFDVSMIEVKPQSIDVVVIGGDKNLGGKNWDDALMFYCADKFIEETGVTDDILSDLETYGDLQISIENAKKTLSTRTNAKIRVIYGTNRVIVEISREKFNELTKHLAERTIVLTDHMLDMAKIKGYSSFDKILLVGDSTKMPQIHDILKQAYPTVPVEFFDPDEAIAKGAAIYGLQHAINDTIKVEETDHPKGSKTLMSDVIRKLHTIVIADWANEEVLTNVVSKSLGLLAFINDKEQKVVNIIFKQTAIPVEISKVIITQSSNQKNIEIAVYENDMSDTVVAVYDSIEVGKFIIDGLPFGMPAGSPVQVTFKINNEGRLEINAVELTNNCKLNLIIKTTSVISGEEFEATKSTDDTKQSDIFDW